jgi:hypothetical protein
MRYSTSSVVAEADSQLTAGTTSTGATAVIYDSTAEATEPRRLVFVDKLMMPEADRVGSRMQSSVNRRSTLRGTRDAQHANSSLIERKSTGNIEAGAQLRVHHFANPAGDDPTHEA